MDLFSPHGPEPDGSFLFFNFSNPLQLLKIRKISAPEVRFFFHPVNQIIADAVLFLLLPECQTRLFSLASFQKRMDIILHVQFYIRTACPDLHHIFGYFQHFTSAPFHPGTPFFLILADRCRRFCLFMRSFLAVWSKVPFWNFCTYLFCQTLLFDIKSTIKYIVFPSGLF